MEGFDSTALWGYANCIYVIAIAVLAPVLGTTPDGRDWVSSSGFAFAYIGSTISFVAGMAVIMLHAQLGFASSWWAVFTMTKGHFISVELPRRRIPTRMVTRPGSPCQSVL